MHILYHEVTNKGLQRAGQALGFFNYKPKWLYKEGRGGDSNPSPHGFILKALTN